MQRPQQDTFSELMQSSIASLKDLSPVPRYAESLTAKMLSNLPITASKQGSTRNVLLSDPRAYISDQEVTVFRTKRQSSQLLLEKASTIVEEPEKPVERPRRLGASQLLYSDFLQKEGSGHKPFVMNTGCCYDDFITEKLKHRVPKNRSYLKESEVNHSNQEVLSRRRKAREEQEDAFTLVNRQIRAELRNVKNEINSILPPEPDSLQARLAADPLR